MAKGSGTTKSVGSGAASSSRSSKNWESSWSPSPISGWTKNIYGQAVSPLKTTDLMMVNRLRDGLIQNNAEYKGISLGNYDGRVVVSGASSAKIAQNFINDLQVAEAAQKAVNSFIKGKTITPQLREDAKKLVAEYEKKINKKLWIS